MHKTNLLLVLISNCLEFSSTSRPAWAIAYSGYSRWRLTFSYLFRMITSFISQRLWCDFIFNQIPNFRLFMAIFVHQRAQKLPWCSVSFYPFLRKKNNAANSGMQSVVVLQCDVRIAVTILCPMRKQLLSAWSISL